MKLITSAAAIVALGATISTGAHADMIVFTPTLPAALTFTPMGSALEVSTSGFGGSAYYGTLGTPIDFGNVSFGSMNFTTQALMAGTGGSPSFFPIVPPATESFTYQATIENDGNPSFPDTLTMSISWTQLVNGGEPELDGTGVVITSSGDTPFTTDFPVGGTTTVQGFFPTGCDLANFGSGSCDILSQMDIGFFEGGDASPGPIITTIITTTTAPEPMSSVMALGIALFCLWGAYQVTRQGRDRSTS